MRILFFIICILCLQSCIFLGVRQNKHYKSVEQIKPVDVIIVPGLPLYNGQWDTLLKARIVWSNFLYKKESLTMCFTQEMPFTQNGKKVHPWHYLLLNWA